VFIIDSFAVLHAGFSASVTLLYNLVFANRMAEVLLPLLLLSVIFELVFCTDVP